jgi:hypothetical protein
VKTALTASEKFRIYNNNDDDDDNNNNNNNNNHGILGRVWDALKLGLFI